jgi:predicted nuclease of predicted toxin-antitoxin system
VKLIIDMNLSPDWVAFLRSAGHEALHWSTVGSPSASDRTITAWAVANGHIIFTNDLDFSAILAATKAETPSVLQVRTQDLLPDAIGQLVLNVLIQFEAELMAGALVSVDASRARVKILPIR